METMVQLKMILSGVGEQGNTSAPEIYAKTKCKKNNLRRSKKKKKCGDTSTKNEKKGKYRGGNRVRGAGSRGLSDRLEGGQLRSDDPDTAKIVLK